LGIQPFEDEQRGMRPKAMTRRGYGMYLSERKPPTR